MGWLIGVATVAVLLAVRQWRKAVVFRDLYLAEQARNRELDTQNNGLTRRNELLRDGILRRDVDINTLREIAERRTA